MRHLTRLYNFLLLLTLLFSQPAVAEQRPYRIAVIIPLSGQVASLGNYVKQGIDLAYSKLSSQQQSQLQLIYEDDQFDPSKTISAYRKLQSNPGIDAVFVMASPPANALGPITDRDKKILIAIGASDPTIAVGKSYSFIHWVIPPVLGEALAKELKRRNLNKIAFLTAEVSGALADTNAAVAALTKLGLEKQIVFQETVPKEETDFRSIITKLREKQVDAVVSVLFPGALSSFAKQFKASKIAAELVGMETFEDESEVKAAAGTLDGTWYVNGSDPEATFIEAYKERYKEHPGWAAGNAYDSLTMISNAIAEVGTDNTRISDYLRNIKDYHGATGKYSASGDNRFTLPAALKRVSGSEFKTITN